MFYRAVVQLVLLLGQIRGSYDGRDSHRVPATYRRELITAEPRWDVGDAGGRGISLVSVDSVIGHIY